MQLLAMPLLAELAAISAASPNAGATTAAAQGGSGDSQSGAAAPFGQLLAQLQGEGGKSLPPAELAAALGISVEQLQQALAQLRQALADYSRQQTGANGIMPALVEDGGEQASPAISEDGEAFLLWLAEQQQGLAGEVDPALLTALQQWLSDHPAPSQPAPAPVAAASAMTDEPGAALMASAGHSQATTTLAATAATTSAPPTADNSEASAVSAPPANPNPVSAAAAAGAPLSSDQVNAAVATPQTLTQPTTQDSATAAAVGAAADLAVSSADKRPPSAPAPAAASPNQGTAAAATNPPASASEQPPVTTLEQGDGEPNTTDSAERRNSGAQTAIAAQQRGGEDGEGDADRALSVQVAGRDAHKGTPPAAITAPTVPSDTQVARDPAKGGATAQVDAAASNADSAERRNSGAQAAIAAQQRGGDTGQEHGGRGDGDQASGRDSHKQAQLAATLAEGDNGPRPMGERLSQWHFQWERASNDAASGISAADGRSDSPDLRQLLNATSSPLQATRLNATPSLESSPLLRQFNADPAAALGPQVQVMVARSLDQMTVRLDPQELGSMSIKVQVGADQQVHVQFQVTNAATRDLVEQSLPRLRELLGDAGVQLADAQVGQQQRDARQMAGDSSGRGSDGRGSGAGQGGDSDAALEQSAEQLQRHSGRLANGRLDFYV